MKEIGFDVIGIGVLGPGMPDWPRAAAALREPSTWQAARTVVPAPQRLPANERRRAAEVVKAALAVADQAVAMAGMDPAQLATVFTSATGDPANCHALCEALAAPSRMVSPTRFTNSVHNAGAGYWHIATQGSQSSTSIAGLDASFGAGLLEAAVQCLTNQEPVLLVASDVVYPAPLHALRPIEDVFAVAWVLVPPDTAWVARPGADAADAAAGAAPDSAAPTGRSRWCLRLCAAVDSGRKRQDLTPSNSPSDSGEMGDLTPFHSTFHTFHPQLEHLRLGNPSARVLPLLQRMALADTRPVWLDGAHSSDADESPWRMQVQLLPMRVLPPAQPATLDHAGIAARVPHAGRMCLLDRLLSWDASSVHCTATSHLDPANPLREGGALLAPVAIEYAAQAMALHGGLTAPVGSAPQPGFLVSARGVQMWVPDLAQVAGPLHVRVVQQAGTANQAMYHFTLHDEQGQLLVQGRATVVLNSPVPVPPGPQGPPIQPALPVMPVLPSSPTLPEA